MIRLVICFLISSLFAIGQNWQGLSGEVNSTVNTMMISPNNKLLIGGSFTEVNGSPQMGLAVWDSVSLTAFGNNANFGNNFGSILCMTYFNGDLVVGGHFDSINNVAVNNIALWNGASWQPIGNGFDNDVQTIAVYNNSLYAGGVFFRSGGDTVRSFAVWNGINWRNAAPQIDGFVLSSLVYDNKLIIGGPFNGINGIILGGVASWNDSSWSNVGSGFNNEVYNLSLVDDTLYACGTFTQIPQSPYSYIAKYNGTDWLQVPYPLGTTQWMTDVEKFHNRLFVCGNFDNPDDLGIVNGNLYDSVGSSNGFISDLIVYKNQLYAGGNYTTIGNVSAICIARLDTNFTNDIVIPNFYENSVFIFPTILTKSSLLNIEDEGLLKSKLVDVEIYSFNGVMISKYNPEEFPVQLNGIAPSSYILKLNYENEKYISKKFIVIP